MKAIKTLIFLLVGVVSTAAYADDFAPTNDNQANAIELTNTDNWCSALAIYSNVGATNDGANSSCGTPNSNVWFKFQATSSYIDIDVKTGGSEGSMRYMEMALWTTGGAEVGCLNKASSSSDLKLEEMGLVVGAWYYLSVYGYYNISSFQGTFSLCVNDKISSDFIEGAVEISNKNNWCSLADEYTSANATSGTNMGSSCDATRYNDVWFKFQAATEYIDLNLTANFSSPEMRLENSAGTEVGCGDERIEIIDLTIGEWYYLSVAGGSSSSSYKGTFSLCANDQIPSDYREGALELTNFDNWCSLADEYSTIDATSGTSMGSSCDGTRYNDVWFKFQAATEYIDLNLTAAYSSPEMKLENSTGTEVGCGEEQIESFDLTIGAWYYLSVGGGSSSSSSKGTFSLCINDKISSDYREGAVELTNKNDWCSLTDEYTTLDATSGTGMGSTCDGTRYNDVWFKFQATTEYIDLKVASGFTQPQLKLENSTGTEVGCGTTQIEKIDLVIGEWYYLSVAGGGSSSSYQGSFSLCVNDQFPPDHKGGAIEIINTTQWCSSPAAYTTVDTNLDGTPSGCDGSVFNDIWFKFQATSTYLGIDLKTDSEGGTLKYGHILLQDAQGNEIACNSGVNTHDVALEEFSLATNSWYYIAIGSTSSNYEGSFSLCLNDQIPSDHKDGAVELTNITNWCSVAAEFSNVDTNSNGLGSECDGSVYNDIWFKFQATTTYIKVDAKTMSDGGSLRYAHMLLQDALENTLACNEEGSTQDVNIEGLNLEIGDWYYLGVGSTGSGNTGTFSLCLDDQTPYDLEVLTMDALPSISDPNFILGEPLSIDFELSNYPSQAEMKYYISANPTLDGSEIIEDSLTLPSGESSHNILINSIVTPGNYYFITVIDPGNKLEETNEANNTKSFPITVSSPDYTLSLGVGVANSSATRALYYNDWSSYLPSQNFWITAIVNNVGDGINPININTKLYWSTDAVLDSSDALLANGTTRVWESFANLPTTTLGTYYIIAELNEDNPLIEFNHTNNTFVKEVKIKSEVDIEAGLVPYTKSLPIISDYTGDHLFVGFFDDPIYNDTSPGEVLYVQSRTINMDSIIYDNVEVYQYLSMDSIFDGSDQQYIPGHTKNFSPAFNSAYGFSNPQVASLALGDTYFMIYVFDPNNLIAETDETNNTVVVPFGVYNPDLILVRSSHLGPVNYDINSSEVTFRGFPYSLVGQVDPDDIEVDYYMSPTANFDANSARLMTHEYEYEGAPMYGVRWTVPADLEGSYHLIAHLDPNNLVVEQDDNNNYITFDEIMVGRPDITATLSGCSPNLRAEATFDVTMAPIELMYGQTREVMVNTYVSSDALLSTGTDTFLGSSLVTTGTNSTLTYSLPAGLAEGNYFVLYQIDADAVVDEINENNNISVCQINLTKPDLEIALANCPTEVLRPGAIYEAQASFTETKFNDPSSSQVAYYFSTDAILQMGTDDEVGRKSILPDVEEVIQFRVPNNLASGSYFLIAQVDADNEVDENPESNNVQACAIAIQEWRDYSLAINSADAQLIPDNTYNASITVSDTEGAINHTVKVVLYLSTNNRLDDGDKLLGTPQDVTTNTATTISYNLPDPLYGGEYYLIFKTDNDDLVTERNEDNNIAVKQIRINGFDNIVETELNHISNYTYGEDGTPIASSRSYFDLSGKLLQSQSKSYATGLITIAEPLYDKLGRKVGNTLAAPMNIEDFVFYPNFNITTDGNAYDYTKFDVAGKITSPDAVGNSQMGTLGWYYSANNYLEPYTATTSYPYNRVEYYADGTGVKRGASVGDEFRMGKEHETETGVFPVVDELNHYKQVRDLFFDGTAYAYKNNAVQYVTKDANGVWYFSFTDADGNALMSAMKGVLHSVTMTLSYDELLQRNFYITESQSVAIADWNNTTLWNTMDDIEVSVGDGTQSLAQGFYKFLPTDVNAPYGGAVTITNSFGDISYNIYNDVGRLVASIAPNGVKEIIDNGIASYTKDNLPFTTYYEYNFQGRLLAITEPDAGRSEYVYRRDGSIRYSQNAEQKLNDKFSYTEYDDLGRPIESGEFKKYGSIAWDFKGSEMMASLETIGHEDTWVDDNKIDWVRTNYDFADPDLPADKLDGSTNYSQDFVLGAVSYTENKNSKTWYNYDEFGRVVRMVQELKTGFEAKYFEINYAYDYLGNVVTVGTKVFSHAGVFQDERYHYYTYDKAQRLHKAYTSTYENLDLATLSDNEHAQLQATYAYYLHGPLKRVELGDKMQGVDYTYTIHGALKAINHPEQSKDPGQDTDDAFSMLLEYYTNDYISAMQANGYHNSSIDFTPQYTGNIAATTWKSAPVYSSTNEFNATKGTYLYQYDTKSQLVNASLATPVFTGANYSYGIAANNPGKVNITGYDANGNIEALTRNSIEGALTDNFAYHYNVGTNQLNKVDNYASSYEYNSIGQLTKEVTIDGSTRNMTYDVTGKVIKVRDGTTTLGQYDYDERGFRIKKYENEGATTYTWYLRDASGKILMTYASEGFDSKTLNEVPIYGAGKIGTIQADDLNSMSYEVNDHLGNVRALVKRKNIMYLATFESASLSTESQLFDNYLETRAYEAFTGVNHTPKINTTISKYISKLTSANRVGPTKILQVKANDKVEMEAYVKYMQPIGASSDGSSIGNMLAEIAAGFGGVNGGTLGEQAIYNVFSVNFGSTLGVVSEPGDFDNEPRAYLQYLFFDTNMNFVRAGYAGITEAAQIQYDADDMPIANDPHEKLRLDFETTEPGYLYIYIANESAQTNVDVYFDDIKLMHSTTMVTQTTDYYPYGSVLQTTKTNEDSHYRYGYQGQFAEEDEETGLTHFELRDYGSRIGRWTATDPYRQHASPYLGMGNNPVNGIDPDGGSVDDIVSYNSSTGKTSIIQKSGDDVLYIDGKFMSVLGENGSWRKMGLGNVTFFTSDLLSSVYGPDPGFLDYVFEDNGGPGHTLVFDPETGKYYEIHNPEGESGASNYISSNGGAKAVGYMFENILELSKSQQGRNSDLKHYRVGVPNKGASLAFYKGYVEKDWGYNLSTQNCKHFVLHGLYNGGVKSANPYYQNEIPANTFGQYIYTVNPSSQ